MKQGPPVRLKTVYRGDYRHGVVARRKIRFVVSSLVGIHGLADVLAFKYYLGPGHDIILLDANRAPNIEILELSSRRGELPKRDRAQ